MNCFQIRFRRNVNVKFSTNTCEEIINGNFFKLIAHFCENSKRFSWFFSAIEEVKRN